MFTEPFVVVYLQVLCGEAHCAVGDDIPVVGIPANALVEFVFPTVMAVGDNLGKGLTCTVSL